MSRDNVLAVAAILIAFLSALFSGWQAYESKGARWDARQAATDARKDSEEAQKLQKELADSAVREAQRSAEAAEKSAEALLATAKTFNATSQLSLNPNIEVEARFQPFGTPPNAPRILLWNTGAADAIAITVSLRSLATSPPPSAGGGTWQMVSDRSIIPERRIAKLMAGDIHDLPVEEQPTNRPPMLTGREIVQPLIELVITYMRATDRKSYEKRGYYFLTQDRRWVSENDPRSKTDINERIKNHLRTTKLVSFEPTPTLDLMHDITTPAPKSGK